MNNTQHPICPTCRAPIFDGEPCPRCQWVRWQRIRLRAEAQEARFWRACDGAIIAAAVIALALFALAVAKTW